MPSYEDRVVLRSRDDPTPARAAYRMRLRFRGIIVCTFSPLQERTPWRFILSSHEKATQDQGELDIYQSKVGETFKGHPVKILAAYGPQQVLEGDAPRAS